MSTNSALLQSGTGENSHGSATMAREGATIGGNGVALHHSPTERESREDGAIGPEDRAMDKKE